jgi:hypothetical protein
MPHNFLKSKIAMVLLSAICLSCANGSMQSNITSPTPEVKLTAVERDIKAMKTANFEYIFVIRRKDEGVFNAEDKAYVKANSPADTNRFVLSDDDKAVVAGSSYKFEPENIAKLRERFRVDDHSVPKAPELNNNKETNVNKPAEK